MDIKLIALDLDGTLLDSSKNISEENLSALSRAAESGIYIVPATGRYAGGMPECIKDLPFLRYAITVNGAAVVDLKTGQTIYSCDIPFERSLQILDYCAGLPSAYDFYAESMGYMERRFWDNIENYLDSEIYCRTVRQTRKPIDEDSRDFIKKRGCCIQKVQLFTRDLQLILDVYDHVQATMPDMIATSSLKNNVEINAKGATKGKALAALAAYLGLDQKQTMAFGDGGNDVEMMRCAGIGVAMANGTAATKKNADLVTLTNDGSGVAYAINRLLFT